MNDSDRPEFARVLSGMATIKPGGKITEEGLDMWWLAMARTWSLKEFKQAAVHLLEAVEFMPSPFHFRELRRALELTPGEAWAIALAACQHWRTPELLPEGRIARAAAGVGGFEAIAYTNPERDLGFIEQRFKQAYSELSDVELTRESLPELSGEPLRILEQRDHARVGFKSILKIEGGGDAQQRKAGV